MKIAITDKGTGITQEFAKAIGATVNGRFIHIPESKGAGYLTGFSWGGDLRMMIRNYHLKEDIFIERTNELAEGQEDVIFLLSGIFPSPALPAEPLRSEQAHMLICRHAVSTLMAMPSHTAFGSVTIAVSRKYLNQLFGHMDHPVVASVLEARENFVFESGISPEIIKTASDLLHQPVPESIERQYYRLKCEELLCHIFAILMQREAVPASAMHIKDIKALYAVKAHLQLHSDQPPHIAALAREAGMSEPKLRKLFKQTFGKGVFEYYQWSRMQKAAQLLREKRLTVSEVGYQLGFTNLSHFARVFEQYTGLKPKKYSAL
ncbi:helix-turn-helix transcriptional regulator [Dyadobacter flavalbus]|uniref:Helix-turn-helix transcriptional regulator n=1 Tax=Dyadobacter flavalbus TaxID=2579942 RepID=A0A5M8QD87_9BACT|nr:helix-turn-helix transcriptional regulator [Dyadobacter flavalbus]KAA6432716.1 helix-turn-helix transcriptional regulator [Dyadobacter flavalbus]